MTNGLHAPRRARPSDHALVAYLAPLVERRRVAVVGPTSGEVARRCRALGASSVVAIGGVGEGIAVRALARGAVEQLHGRADVIVVPDAGAVDLDAVLDEARRALGQDGTLVVAARQAGSAAGLERDAAPSDVTYDALQSALASRFATVRMLGTGSFVGFAVALLDGGDDAGVTLDTRLMPDEPLAAESYVAIAGDRATALDAIALVQVPAAELLGASPDPAVAGRVAALENELRAVEARTKDGETALAERWVRIQRLEHELKALDEDARKARDRAVKLSKDLEDERKLRQRVEIDAQMVRRVPDAPRVDPDEARGNAERLEALAAQLQKANALREAAERKASDLARELDETQATEAELRAQLDELETAARKPPAVAAKASAPAVAAVQATALPGAEYDALRTDYERVERDLGAAARSLVEGRAQLAARDEAVRELAYALEAASRHDAVREVLELRGQLAEQSALAVALAGEAQSIVEQNEALRERVAHLDHALAARDEAPGESSATAEAMDLARSREAIAQAAATAANARVEEGARALALAEAEIRELTRALDEARTSARDLERRLGESRTDLTRQYAIGSAAESQVAVLRDELEQLRAAARATLPPDDRETTVPPVAQTGSDAADVVRAELRGARFRLADAEAALAARSVITAPAPERTLVAASLLDDDEDERASGGGLRTERLLTDLAETAGRLAATEEALAEARARAAALEGELATTRTDPQRRDAGAGEALARSLIAQLEDRDLRLRAMERRLVDDVEQARRAESEIWEAEMHARDERIAALERSGTMPRERVSQSVPPPGEAEHLRNVVARVRSGLSAILVDGRGAVVAHDLVALLRALDEPAGP